MTPRSDLELLADAYEAIMTFCDDERWRGTAIGDLAEELAERLNEPPPYPEAIL